LDDVRDLDFVVRHQDKVQGKYDAHLEFGTTQSGQYSFSRNLFATPIVVTINYTTKHLEYLEQNDFLGNAGNRVLVTWPPAAAAPAAA